MAAHRSRQRVTRLFAVLAVLAAMLGLTANFAGAVHDDDVFELEGNLVDSTSVAGDDWVTLRNDNTGPAGGSSAFTGILNDRVDDDTYFSGGGSKDHIDIPSWGSNGNSAPPKDEITNAYAASYDVGGDHVIYFGVDRGATNGDAQMGFWFFQNTVEPDGAGGFDGTHVARDDSDPNDVVNGDLLVLSDFTKGGKVGSVKVFEWVGDDSGSHGNLDLILSQSEADGQPSPQCGADPQPTPDDSVCAIENPGNVPVPTGWSYDANNFPKSALLEGGINVTDLFPDSNPCFASFQAETRSSQETTATLKDFVNGAFEPCFPGTTLTAAAASPAIVHNGESTTARFTETNDGDVSLGAPANGFFECSSTAGTTTVAPVLDTSDAHDPDHNVGDTSHDGILDAGEAWQFDCTVSSISGASGTQTITGTGHGIDPSTGDDVTWCADTSTPPDGEPDAGAGQFCDQGERATTTFSVINPNTVMASSVDVTYTFTETNNGDGPLTRTDATASNNFVRSADCTISEKLVVNTTFNIGDNDGTAATPPTENNGVLDVGETWTFTCTRTFTSAVPGPHSTVAIGHGTDSASTGKDITYCTNPTAPPTGVRCDQDERQEVVVTFNPPAAP